MKILIAVPTFESIYPDTFKSIYDLDTTGHDVTFEFVRGYDCATARNKIAQLASNYEYVLMVDSDVVLPKDALINLLDDPKDVCLGYCPRRSSGEYHGQTSIFKLLTETGSRWKSFPPESAYTGAELAELKAKEEYKVHVHGGGMACALIKADVFQRLKYPWFDWINYKDKGVLSEDLFFCEGCRKNSIPVYADTRVSCGHVFRHVQY
ncbi:MAG: hypothetical protein J6112_03655 [Clostridia bacterium]|nr:hypothetical protein [Clostridia bacterium]